jgi:hypothetical protein
MVATAWLEDEYGRCSNVVPIRGKITKEAFRYPGKAEFKALRTTIALEVVVNIPGRQFRHPLNFGSRLDAAEGK